MPEEKKKTVEAAFAEVEESINNARKALRESDAEVTEISKQLNEIDKLANQSIETAYKLLDRMHARLKEIYDSISSSYGQIKMKYNTLRDDGIDVIEKQILEIRRKKTELLDLGYKVDDAIRNFEIPETLLAMRQKEVLLFNSIEDCYSAAMLTTTRIKNLDSKANLLGYEFAEFTGKLYGLNNTLVIVGNTLENIGNIGQSGTISGRQPRPRFGDSREGKDFEHYIR